MLKRLFRKLAFKLKYWKPIKLCWWFKKHGWNIPKFLVGHPGTEDFTTYTENDANGRFTVTSSKIDVSGLRRDDQGHYVYKDKGVNHFDGDFEFLFEASVADVGSDDSSWMYMVMVANAVNDFKGLEGASEDCIAADVYPYRPNDGDYRWGLQELDSGTGYLDYSYAGYTFDTLYYLTLKRDENVGTYGTAYLYVYSDAARTTLVDSYSIALHTSKKDYQYIYGVSARGDSPTAAEAITGYVQNLDLQEAATETVTTTAKARIKQTGISKTIQAKARIKAEVSKTLTARGRIKQEGISKQVQSKARIKQVDITKTISSQARILTTEESIIQAKARLKTLNEKLISAKARVKQTDITKTLQSQARIKIEGIDNLLSSKARIKATIDKLTQARARIFGTQEKALTTQARIKIENITKTISALAKIVYTYEQLIQTRARIKALQESLITAKGRIKQLGIEKDITARGRIQYTYTETISSQARIERLEESILSSRARIKVLGTEKIISAKTRIKLLATEKQFTVKARIKALGITKTISALARIKITDITNQISAMARMLRVETKGLTTKAKLTYWFGEGLASAKSIPYPSAKSIPYPSAKSIPYPSAKSIY